MGLYCVSTSRTSSERSRKEMGIGGEGRYEYGPVADGLTAYWPLTVFASCPPNGGLSFCTRHRYTTPMLNRLQSPLRGESRECRSTMQTANCPKCGTAKTKLAPRSGVADRLLGTFTIYPFRCQLCAHRFTAFLGKLKTNPRRNYERVPVQYSAQVRPVHDSTQRIVVEGTMVNLSLRGCRIRTSQRLPMGCHVMLELQPGEYDLPIMIDEAIVRARFTDGVGLRFSSFLRSEESRLRRILDLRLPDHAI